MGVKLDWDIEAEKGKHKEHREDGEQRKSRRLGVFRLLLVVAVFALFLGAIVYLVFQRVEQVDQYVEQLLTDTVQAEVAALRVGDLDAFLAQQKSATGDWEVTQSQTFEAYQSLKVSSDVVLSGRIISVEIDDQRGRVQVEEIIDGVPYVRTWNYWRYTADVRCLTAELDETVQCDEGWFHVPPDYTFWGDSATIENDNYIIRYRTVDEQVARALDASLDNWFVDLCSYFDCATIPFITVDIIPAPQSPVRWQEGDAGTWQLIIPSPYTDLARADIPFDNQLQIDVAEVFVSRIIDQTTANDGFPSSDALYLRNSITAWLVGRFVQLNPETYLLESLIAQYGNDIVVSILRNLQPTSDISLLATSAGVASVADLQVDWRDFVLWRLESEDDLIEARNEAGWIAFYDFTDNTVRDVAYQRYQNNFIASSRIVSETSITVSSTGIPQLIARVNVTRGFETGEEIIVFNLVNGNWLRAN